jgi:hypothetical protein
VGEPITKSVFCQTFPPISIEFSIAMGLSVTDVVVVFVISVNFNRLESGSVRSLCEKSKKRLENDLINTGIFFSCLEKNS